MQGNIKVNPNGFLMEFLNKSGIAMFYHIHKIFINYHKINRQKI